MSDATENLSCKASCKTPFSHIEKYIGRFSCRFQDLELVKLQNVLKLGNEGLSSERHG
jgi:hypothetical protein